VFLREFDYRFVAGLKRKIASAISGCLLNSCSYLGGFGPLLGEKALKQRAAFVLTNTASDFRAMIERRPLQQV